MDPVLVENPKPGLIQKAESGPLESIVGQAAVAEQNRSKLRRCWAALAVLLLTTILYFVRLGARALWASEFRWAEIAREMLLTHNYFWPTINGRVYFDKPLGSYWLVLVSAWITGRMDEAATRIPGAMAGVLAVVLLILLTRRLYNLQTGIAAGFILATSFGFAFWARTASADVETVTGELAALVIFVNNENRAGWWVVPMWLVMALTSLMKGLLGFILPIIVICVYSCVAEGWLELKHRLIYGPLSLRIHWLIERNRWFFNRRTGVAVALAGAIYLAPFVISYAGTGSAKGMYMVYRENVERYFTPFDHRGPIYLYAYVIFELMAPWSAFLPAALVYAHSHAEIAGIKLRSDRFVLAFFWTIFIFFTVSGSRRSYYILPILPAASILVARVFIVIEKDLSELSRFLLKVGFGMVLSVLALSVVIILPPQILLPTPYSLLPTLPWPWIFATCWILSFGTAVYAFICYSRKRILLAVSVTSYLMLCYLFMFAMPAGDQWRGEKSFAEAVRQLIDGCSAELVSFKTQPPVFYLGLAEPVPQYDTLAELKSAITSGRIKWVILRRRDVLALDMPAHVAIFEPNYPWNSREHHLNALVLMELER
ncbi:MAG: glycosyltransferase family 39 protein [Deltaproteobacteria bacterium]|nr:glycosyltransferase family 39 protein [Deltaproteobacteria bacterium]